MRMTDTDTMKRLTLDMSNFDHSFDEGLDEALRAKPGEVCARYIAANFCAYVWFSIDGFFHVQVWIHRTARKELCYETLKDVMIGVSDIYGYE